MSFVLNLGTSMRAQRDVSRSVPSPSHKRRLPTPDGESWPTSAKPRPASNNQTSTRLFREAVSKARNPAVPRSSQRPQRANLSAVRPHLATNAARRPPKPCRPPPLESRRQVRKPARGPRKRRCPRAKPTTDPQTTAKPNMMITSAPRYPFNPHTDWWNRNAAFGTHQ